MAPAQSRIQLSCLDDIDDIDPEEIRDDMDAELESHSPQAWDIIENEELSPSESEGTDERAHNVESISTGVTERTGAAYRRCIHYFLSS